MFLLALLALGLAQDPPAPKTAEERLRELEQKLAQLEKRQRAAALENETLEKQLAEQVRAREAYVKQLATFWVKRFQTPAEFTPQQAAELETLWIGWTRADLEKLAPPQTWVGREAEIRKRLTAEQLTKLSRAVGTEQKESGKVSLQFMLMQARLSPENQKEAERVVLGRLSAPEDLILPQAHPELQIGWNRVLEALKGSLEELAKTLTPEEQARLRKMFVPERAENKR